MSRLMLAAAVVVAALGGISAASQPPGTTKLQIEISGGFAYIPEPANRRLHIAYLNNVYVAADHDTDGDGDTDNNDAPVCDVRQIGTELMVLRGNIIESSPASATPANHIYNLDRARLIFPKLENATITLSTPRTPGTPSGVTAPPNWKDLQFVPSIKEFHGGTSDVIPNWRQNVNGFITVRGGNFEGGVPTDPLVQATYFKFTQQSTSFQGASAVTDKVIYTVDVPDNEVDIRFQSSSFGYQRLRITAPAPNKPVRLRLRGLHSMNTAASYADGDEIKDFCAFYSLFRLSNSSPSPTPMSSAQRLRMFYRAPAMQAVGGDQPSPGFFCDGVWF